MTDEELQILVQEISNNEFQLPFLHQAIFNTRLRSTGGRYHLTDHHLDFNPEYLEQFGIEIFSNIVKHELCHYHLHLANKGYRHKDSDFKRLLSKTGGLRFAPPLKGGKKFNYSCLICHQEVSRKRRLDTTKYRCGACGGKLA